MASPQLKTELCYLNIPAQSKGPKQAALVKHLIRLAWGLPGWLGVPVWVFPCGK